DLRAEVYAAALAQEEVRGPEAEAIAPEQRGFGDVKREASGGVGGGARAVGATEPALAGAHAPGTDRQGGPEGQAERAAVTAADEGVRRGRHEGGDGRALGAQPAERHRAGWLQGRLADDFFLSPGVRVKAGPVCRERHVAVPRVVLAHPRQQKRQALVLLLAGGILVRLPGTGAAVRQAALDARVEKEEQRLPAPGLPEQRRLPALP